jgi:hypothetical protein
MVDDAAAVLEVSHKCVSVGRMYWGEKMKIKQHGSGVLKSGQGQGQALQLAGTGSKKSTRSSGDLGRRQGETETIG